MILNKIIRLLLLFASFNSFSNEVLTELDFKKICNNTIDNEAKFKVIKIDNKDVVILDKGFCLAYFSEMLEDKANESLKLLPSTQQQYIIDNSEAISTPNTNGDRADKWKVRFYASHSFTTYFDTDVTFKSTRYNVIVKDYSWAERSSREFFLPETWQEEGNNPFQWIDEPTNTFVLSIERDGHEFFLSAFHPKFLQEVDQVKKITGTIDGVGVDGWQAVNRPFDGYNQSPGEMELVRNQNTHLQMTFEIGYGYRFKIVDTKVGNITWVPSIGFGVMIGSNFNVIVKENDWWNYDDYSEKLKIQGLGGSLTNRIEFNTKKEQFGIFYENKFGLYHQNHGFLDGTQEYNLLFMGNSVGVKFKILDANTIQQRKFAKKPKL